MKHETSIKRLQELAAINNPFSLKEAVDPNQMLKLEVTIKAGKLIEMFGGAEVLAATVNDPNKFKQFTATVEEDLVNWFNQYGDEWANEGVESGNYDEFIPFN